MEGKRLFRLYLVNFQEFSLINENDLKYSKNVKNAINYLYQNKKNLDFLLHRCSL